MKPIEKSFSELVAKRLKELNTNAYSVERRANLPPDAIRNVIRSSKKSGPTLSRAQEICEAIGLELIIGPERNIGPISKTSLTKAIELVEKGLLENSSYLDPRKKAELVFVVSEFLEDGRSDETIEKVGDIIRIAS